MKNASENDDRAKQLADKVNFLFQTCRKDNGDRYTYSDVEELSNAKIHQSWIWKLANGKAIRPSADSLKALTDFFGISPDFWFSDLNDDLKNKVTLEQAGEDVLLIATQASELTPIGRQQVINLIKALKDNGFDGS